MIKFKKFFLLAEEIKQPDIIDLYIMMAMGKPDDVKYKDIYDKVFRNAIRGIKEEIENILLRELRHALNHADMYDDKQIEKTFPNIDPYVVRTSINWLMHNWKYDKEIKEISIDEFAGITNVPWNIDTIIQAFKDWDWSSSYGGDAWAKIAINAKKLLQAGSGDMVEELDRFIDYVHNTGAVANKFKGYEEGWLNYILDLKAQSRNIRELIPFASHAVQQLFRDSGWQITLRNMKGLGAVDSDGIIIDMIKKYMLDITDTLQHIGTWASGMGYVEDWGMDNPELGKQIMSHLNLVKLIDEYGIDRVINAINKAKESDKELKKIIDDFLTQAYDTIDESEYTYLYKNQQAFLEGLGFDLNQNYDEEDEDYFSYNGKKTKKPHKKKPLGKHTFYDKNRDEWVQVNKSKKKHKGIYRDKGRWREE